MATTKHYVDLSVPMANAESNASLGASARLMSPTITYLDHLASRADMARVYQCDEADLPQGIGWGAEIVTLGTHAGTHLDAPYHFFPTCAGRPAKTIDQMPLEMCFSKGYVFDVRHITAGKAITAADLQQICRQRRRSIRTGETALIMTGADKRATETSYWSEFPGMSAEATLWLIEQGISLMGTDAIGWDIPFGQGAELFRQTGDNSILWEAHRVGKDHEYYHMEKLANLDQLPPYGFDLVCIPIAIKDGSAGWVRPVAIVKEKSSKGLDKKIRESYT
jgi:kynurenine formamidase